MYLLYILPSRIFYSLIVLMHFSSFVVSSSKVKHFIYLFYFFFSISMSINLSQWLIKMTLSCLQFKTCCIFAVSNITFFQTTLQLNVKITKVLSSPENYTTIGAQWEKRTLLNNYLGIPECSFYFKYVMRTMFLAIGVGGVFDYTHKEQFPGSR